MTKQKAIHKHKASEERFFWSKFSPGMQTLIAIGVLYLVTVILFRGIIFQNAAFSSEGDTAAAKSYEVAGNRIAQAEGVDVLWMPFFFSGMPTFGNVAYLPHNVSYIQRALSWVLNFLYLNGTWTWYIVYYLLGGVFMFLLARTLGFSQITSLFAALVFMLAPYSMGLASEGHGSKLMALCYLPLVFMLTHMLFERRDLLSFGLLAAALGTLLLTNHMQIVYYVLAILALYLLDQIILDFRENKTRALWKTLLFVGALLIGFAISSYIYLSVYEYSQYSIRGGGEAGVSGGLTWEYATSWSWHPQEILTLLIPSFFGFQNPYYWGTMPFTNSTVYVGILPLLLAVLALIYRRTRLTIFMAILTLLLFFVSFGKHFPVVYELLFNTLPFFNKFRVPVMILQLLPFTIGILAAIGLEFLLTAHDRTEGHETHKTPRDTAIPKLNRGLLYAAGVLGGLLILGLLFKTSLFQSMSGSMFVKEGEQAMYQQQYGNQTQQIMAQLKQARFDMLWKDFVKFVFIAAGSIGIVVMFLNRKIRASWFVASIFVILVVDLYLVINKGNYIDPKPRTAMEQQFQPDGTIAFLQQQPGLFRVLPLGRNPANGQDYFMDNTFGYHGVQSVGGYNPAKLKIYQTMLDSCLLRGSDPAFPVNMNIVNMLNAQYIVAAGKLPEERFRLVNTDTKKGVLTYMNPTVLPRAWFVEEATTARNAIQVFNALNSPAFDVRRSAVVEKPIPQPIGRSDSTSVDVTEFKSRSVTLKAYTASQALLVVSEVYYPAGWKAYLDGAETEIFKTNSVLRSVVVPAGTHEVVFKYQPALYDIGYTVTRAAWGVAFVCILAGLWGLPAVRKRILRSEPSETSGIH
jgi:hypothetical protein